MATVVTAPTIVWTVQDTCFISLTVQIIHEYVSSSSAKIGNWFHKAILIAKHFADDKSFFVVKFVITDGPPAAIFMAYFNPSTVEPWRLSPTH